MLKCLCLLLFFQLPALPSGSGDVPGEAARRAGTSRLMLQSTKPFPKDAKPLPKPVVLKEAGSRAFQDFLACPYGKDRSASLLVFQMKEVCWK